MEISSTDGQRWIGGGQRFNIRRDGQFRKHIRFAPFRWKTAALLASAGSARGIKGRL
jgi:hypothetical protein